MVPVLAMKVLISDWFNALFMMPVREETALSIYVELVRRVEFSEVMLGIFLNSG